MSRGGWAPMAGEYHENIMANIIGPEIWMIEKYEEIGFQNGRTGFLWIMIIPMFSNQEYITTNHSYGKGHMHIILIHNPWDNGDIHGDISQESYYGDNMQWLVYKPPQLCEC